ncbi:MAG: glycosyltransferase family 8 protein [Geminicoccaceae bacterium]|nr:glycosyltransferase family 8 protein [Geminicoccaceae bacterium]
MAGAAWVTLVTNADYGLGALALARSLKRVGSAYPLVVLATGGAGGLEALEAEGCRIVGAAPLPFSDGFRVRHGRGALHAAAPFTKGGKPAFHDPIDNFQKLRLWRLAGLERAAFLDADTLVVKPIDGLMAYPEFSAAPNLYETLHDFRRLNSGVFAARPDPATFEDMIERLDTGETFWRRTDQTFLEAYFPDWHGLPYTFNALQYLRFNLPELWHWPSIRVVHYQYEKPWQRDHPKRDRLGPLIDLWWAILEGREVADDVPPWAP